MPRNSGSKTASEAKSLQKSGQHGRREFALNAGLALLGGVWTESAWAHSRSANEALNLGAIGVANRGETNLIEVQGENIAALCDVDEKYLSERADRYRKARTYTDYRKLLEQPDLDGVIISSPDHTHAHAAIQALQRGLHVYCEKPLANTIDEVRAMAAAARSAPVATQTGTQHHSSLGYRRAVEAIRSGILGPIQDVHCWTNRPFWPQAMATRPVTSPIPQHLHWNLWLGPAPARPYADAYHPTNWRGFWDFGTGALGDRGPHLLDPIVTALELSAPTHVSAVSSGVTAESPPEWSIVTFQFAARDQAPAVQLKWYDGGKQPPKELAKVKDRLPDNGSLLIGTRARMFIPELGGAPILISDDPDGTIETLKVPMPMPINHYVEWIHACKGMGKTSCDFEFGARLTGICLLGNVALRTGGEIQWDPSTGTLVGCPEAKQYLSREYRDGWKLR